MLLQVQLHTPHSGVPKGLVGLNTEAELYAEGKRKYVVLSICYMLDMIYFFFEMDRSRVLYAISFMV